MIRWSCSLHLKCDHFSQIIFYCMLLLSSIIMASCCYPVAFSCICVWHTIPFDLYNWYRNWYIYGTSTHTQTGYTVELCTCTSCRLAAQTLSSTNRMSLDTPNEQESKGKKLHRMYGCDCLCIYIRMLLFAVRMRHLRVSFDFFSILVTMLKPLKQSLSNHWKVRCSSNKGTKTTTTITCERRVNWPKVFICFLLRLLSFFLSYECTAKSSCFDLSLCKRRWFFSICLFHTKSFSPRDSRKHFLLYLHRKNERQN